MYSLIIQRHISLFNIHIDANLHHSLDNPLQHDTQPLTTGDRKVGPLPLTTSLHSVRQKCNYTFKYLSKIPRTAPLLSESFVLLVMFKADQQPMLHAREFVSLQILVWIVAGFFALILSTNRTCFLGMITGFLSGGDNLDL